MKKISLKQLTTLVSILAIVLAFSGCGQKKAPITDNENHETATSTDESATSTGDTATSTNARAEDTATSTDEIDTSDWKVYRNEEYGFELRYPNTWYLVIEKDHILIKNTKDEVILGGIKPDDMTGKTLDGSELSIEFYNNPSQLTIEDWVQTQPNIPTLSYKDTFINGLEAKIVKPLDGIFYGNPNIFIKNKKQILNIKFLTTNKYQYNKNVKYFNSIIEKLKFKEMEQ